MSGSLYGDDDVDYYFEEIVRALNHWLGVSMNEAGIMAREYYLKFTDEDYCKSIGIPVQNDEVFFQDGPVLMAFRVYYCMVLADYRSNDEFLAWSKRAWASMAKLKGS